MEFPKAPGRDQPVSFTPVTVEFAWSLVAGHVPRSSCMIFFSPPLRSIERTADRPNCFIANPTHPPLITDCISTLSSRTAAARWRCCHPPIPVAQFVKSASTKLELRKQNASPPTRLPARKPSRWRGALCTFVAYSSLEFGSP